MLCQRAKIYTSDLVYLFPKSEQLAPDFIITCKHSHVITSPVLKLLGQFSEGLFFGNIFIDEVASATSIVVLVFIVSSSQYETIPKCGETCLLSGKGHQVLCFPANSLRNRIDLILYKYLMKRGFVLYNNLISYFKKIVYHAC